jgi:hypothetical protein
VTPKKNKTEKVSLSKWLVELLKIEIEKLK